MFIIKLENGEMYAGTKKQIIELGGKPKERKVTVWYQPFQGSDFFLGQVDGECPKEPMHEGDYFKGYRTTCRNNKTSPMKEILSGKVKYIGKRKAPDYFPIEKVQ